MTTKKKAKRKRTRKKTSKHRKPKDMPKLNGRPTLYRKVFDEMAYNMMLLGATQEQLAAHFGVDVATIEKWIKKHEGFRRAVKEGGFPADAAVAASLFQRACGYEHEDTKFFCHMGTIVSTTYTKKYAPDTAAAFIWLKNRAGWVDKRHVEQDVREYDPDACEEIRIKARKLNFQDTGDDD